MKKAILNGIIIVAATTLALAVPPIPKEVKTGGFAIGVQAWSFNRFTLFEAIEKTAETGGKVIEFYPGQPLSPDQKHIRFDHNINEEIINKVKTKLQQHGIVAIAYGVVGIPNNETEARKIFEFAKKMGIRLISTESTEAIDLIEKLVKEYDIYVGYHNHPRQPNNPNYKVWDPNYIAELLKNRDPRVGATGDTGHWLRSELDPVECLRVLRGRIVGLHLKDLNQKTPTGHDVPYGTGVANIPAILDELRAQGFEGPISIEYEHDWEANLPEISQCIGFVRGYGSAKGWN